MLVDCHYFNKFLMKPRIKEAIIFKKGNVNNRVEMTVKVMGVNYLHFHFISDCHTILFLYTQIKLKDVPVHDDIYTMQVDFMHC
jgi:hypothetical protein